MLVIKSLKPTCSVIIVTHNSQAVIPACLQALLAQTHPPGQIVIVDSGSAQTDYLTAYASHPTIQLDLQKENIGFCQGNNQGLSHVPAETDYILFLNPDAFLTPTFIQEALALMEQPSCSHVGALSGLLWGYDQWQKSPTGRLDSAGIFRTWYGRWYDRGQGNPYQEGQYNQIEAVPALCGALMFCRHEALKSVLLGPHQVMDPSFYMYKEDIDLSLRLRRKGWALYFCPHLLAYHCRGWQKDRSQVPRHFRLLSARNEMRLYVRLFSPCYFYAALKYLVVKVFNL